MGTSSFPCGKFSPLVFDRLRRTRIGQVLGEEEIRNLATIAETYEEKDDLMFPFPGHGEYFVFSRTPEGWKRTNHSRLYERYKLLKMIS